MALVTGKPIKRLLPRRLRKKAGAFQGNLIKIDNDGFIDNLEDLAKQAEVSISQISSDCKVPLASLYHWTHKQGRPRKDSEHLKTVEDYLSLRIKRLNVSLEDLTKLETFNSKKKGL